MTSIFTLFAIQTARIQDKLYPITANPPHATGPRRPDMQAIEASLPKQGLSVEA